MMVSKCNILSYSFKIIAHYGSSYIIVICHDFKHSVSDMSGHLLNHPTIINFAYSLFGAFNYSPIWYHSLYHVFGTFPYFSLHPYLHTAFSNPLLVNQGWFTPGNHELSAWRRSFLPSTNVISDTGQVQIPGTCEAHEWNVLEVNNSLYLFKYFYFPKKGLQTEEVSTQVTARTKRCLFLFFPLAEKRLQK